MDAAELSQFIVIAVVALAAFVAAPIVAYLAERPPRRPRPGQRRISTQRPIMQF